MNEWLELAMKLAMVTAAITAMMVIVCRVAWTVYYRVLGWRNPIGKTVVTGIAALWLICAGIYAII